MLGEKCARNLNPGTLVSRQWNSPCPFVRRPVLRQYQQTETVFLSVLHGIGADDRHHGKLRSAVFTHMENESIQSALRAIYQGRFEECVGHRSAETDGEQNACGIVIHALASLLGVDILIHWVAEDGKLEWMLGLASLQKGVSNRAEMGEFSCGLHNKV